MHARKRMYLAGGLFVAMWLSAWWEWLGPVKLPTTLWGYILLPVALAGSALMLQALWSNELYGDTYPRTTGWPHDRDATERFTQPLSDPYATQPYDPQADIPTEIIDYDDYWDPHRYRGSIHLPPDVD